MNGMEFGLTAAMACGKPEVSQKTGFSEVMGQVVTLRTTFASQEEKRRPGRYRHSSRTTGRTGTPETLPASRSL
jgi:hypothetical protein